MGGPPVFQCQAASAGNCDSLICSSCFRWWTLQTGGDQQKFFRTLGRRIRELRRKAGHSQEDMISFVFSARHWQQIEAGRPSTVTTLLRICETFRVPMATLVRGLDRGLRRR